MLLTIKKSILTEPKEISIEQFRRFAVKEPVSQTGKEALAVLKSLKSGRPMLLDKASRGMQVSLSRRIKKNFPDVEMRVSKRPDGTRDLALLLAKK